MINGASKLDRYSIPEIDDLFAKLGGVKVFAKLDLSKAYLQIPLDKNSFIVSVINTYRSLYK